MLMTEQDYTDIGMPTVCLFLRPLLFNMYLFLFLTYRLLYYLLNIINVLLQNPRRKLMKSTQRFFSRNMNETNKVKMEVNPRHTAFTPANNIELIQTHDALWSAPAIMTNGLLQHNRNGKSRDFQQTQILVIFCILFQQLLRSFLSAAILSLSRISLTCHRELSHVLIIQLKLPKSLMFL